MTIASPSEVAPLVESALLDAVRHARGLATQGAEELAQALYAGWYASWSPPSSAEPRPASGVPRGGRSVIEALRAAHADSPRFETGWVVVDSHAGGRVVAARGPVRRALDAIDYLRTDSPGTTPQPGEELLVSGRRDSVSAQPGYWVTYGAAWRLDAPPSRLLRLYWNVGAHEAPALVRELTGALAGTPYSLKCPVDRLNYARVDAAVLFLPQDRFDPLVPELRRVHATLKPVLGTATPALAKPLGRGLALAEDPPDGASFGASRCLLVAQALCGDPAWRERDPASLLPAINERFEAAGVPPERPHLSSRSGRDYSL